MVSRTKMDTFDEFEGIIQGVKEEQDPENEMHQFHIEMKPINKEIKGKTGLIHEWIRISPKATETSIPEGSVLDKYIQQVELLFPEAKEKEFINDVLLLIEDKKFLFKKMRHGKAYDGKEARDYWTPVKVL